MSHGRILGSPDLNKMQEQILRNVYDDISYMITTPSYDTIAVIFLSFGK